MKPPTNEMLYIISLREILWGTVLVAITMGMHGFGMLSILRINGVLKHRIERKPTFTKGVFMLIAASCMILSVHLFEVLAWAAFFLWKGAVNSASANGSLCYYFALNEYTTIGSNYNLTLDWRLLEGVIAMTGLLTFAWSTGILLTLAQDFQDQQLQLLKQKREKRPPAAAHPVEPDGRRSA